MERVGFSFENAFSRGSKCTHKEIECRYLTLQGLRQLERNDPRTAGVTLDEGSWGRRVGRAISDSDALRKLCVVRFEDDEGEIWLGELCQALARNRSIECLSLDMSDNVLDLDIFLNLTPFLEKNHNLRHISVSEDRGPGPKTFNSLVSALSKWKNSGLEYISVASWDATDEQSAAFFDSLREHRNVSVVMFNGIILEKKGCTALSALLENPGSNIHTLYLVNINIPDPEVEDSLDGVDDECISIISNALIQNRTLRSLSLSCSVLSATGWNTLSSFLSHHTCTLEILLLGGCRLGDEGITSLGEALTVNKSLKCLDLGSFDSITLAGCQELSKCLRTSTSALEELFLEYRNMNDEKILVLIEALAGNASFKKLQVKGYGVTDGVLKVLSRLLCDKASIDGTCASNHTFCRLITERHLPPDISSLLKINENDNKSEVARHKILEQHFIGRGNVGTVNHVFASLPEIVLPLAIEYVGRNNNHGLTPMYNAVRGYPAMFHHCLGSMICRGMKRKGAV